MMSVAIRAIGALWLVAVLTAPQPAFAQEAAPAPIPFVEVSGGYMLMRDTTIEENFPGGWYFSSAVNATRWFGVVGEVAGSYKKLHTDINDLFNDLTFSNRLQLYTFLGGPRFFYRAGRVVPFAQVLAGAVHARTKLQFPGFASATMSETDFAVQPGGGVTFYLSERVGLRVAGDYRCLIDKDGDEWNTANEFRAIAGLTFGWGAR